MNIETVFDFLDDWRHLPGYQLERRAAIFFAIHLEAILFQTMGVQATIVLPEFPVRKGAVSGDENDNSSYKIDYLVYDKAKEAVFLIELKTDQRSRRTQQDEYLEKAAALKVEDLAGELLKIYKATRQKVKYNNLLDRIEHIGWIKRSGSGITHKNCKIQPSVLYIQPLNPKEEANVISFDDIITALGDSTAPLTQRFLTSLEKWKLDVNLQHV